MSRRILFQETLSKHFPNECGHDAGALNRMRVDLRLKLAKRSGVGPRGMPFSNSAAWVVTHSRARSIVST